MNNPTVTAVYNLIILDESGSMQSIKQPTINGFNEIIQSIRHDAKEHPQFEQWLNFYSFNGAGIREQLPLGKVDDLPLLSEENYIPDHMTPLYDAIGYACNKLRYQLENKEGYKVVVTILTDGEENASREYDGRGIGWLIQLLRDKGWIFTYVGANQDVEKVAMSINIKHSMRFEASDAGTGDMVQSNISSRKKFMDKLSANKLSELDENYFDGSTNSGPSAPKLKK